jgi:hypothetical protein
MRNCCGRDTRRAIRRLLEDNPSFRPDLPAVVASASDDAAAIVSAVTERLRGEFPERCPFTVEQLLDEAYLP